MTVWRPWLLAWAGGAVVAVGNGTVRELVLRRVLEDDPARQLSTITLLILLTGYMWLLERTWPLPSTRTALAVGVVWVALTVAFDFVLGHYVEHKSWAALLGDYDVGNGAVWVAVPLWTLVGPALVRRLRRSLGREAAGLSPGGGLADRRSPVTPDGRAEPGRAASAQPPRA